jgi:DNA repair exonuclease SbcCD ATPase subunit
VTSVDEIIDGLYALPPGEFVGARNRAAADLRKEGSREDADRVKALRKPNAAAAAVNALVREHRREVDRYLVAASALRDAQFGGKGDFAGAAKLERETLERLIQLGGENVRQSLLAAAVDEEAAAQLLEARLERELEPRGFGTLLSHVSPAGGKTAPRKQPKPDDREARARLQEAKQALTAAEAEERQVRRRLEQAERQVEEAREAVESAQRELDRVRAG